MRKLFDADGNEIEVPTEEEIKELQDKAEKFKGQEDYEKLKEKLAEYESNPSEKNWKSMRTTVDNLKKALSEQGKNVDVDEQTGEVKLSTEAKFSQEDFDNRARAIANQALLDAEKSRSFAKYDNEKRQVVEHYYNKLSAGEEMNIDNLNKFIKEAEKLAGVEIKQTPPSLNGQPPVFEDQGRGFAESEQGKNIAKNLFGDNNYSNQYNK